MVVIYKATCVDGRVYIGMTSKTLKWRKWQHESKSGKYATHFSRAIAKYGKGAFEWEILEECYDWESACGREIYWIGHYDSTNTEKGFNLNSGGDRATHNSRTRLVISEVVKPRMKDPGVIAAIKAANQRRKGSQLSIEHRQKLANCNGAREFEVRNKDTDALVGTYANVRLVAELFGLKREHIRACLRGKGYRSTGGYTFKYL
jgi:group I intron endonuclease